MITSTTASTFAQYYRPVQTFTLQFELPGNGGRSVLRVTAAEFERFKRGAAMLAGEFRDEVAKWDSMTPAERAQYERDADWVCLRVEQCKLRRAEV